MAKKKKPATNPARGFATTSIASKPKPEGNDDKPGPTKAPQPQKSAGDAQTNLPLNNSVVSNDEKPKEKELHELTPEELTAKLEHEELQMLVESLGPKVRREVARLDSKLRTDSRVLRSQAQEVSLRRWLPEELMIAVLDALKKERDDAMRAPTQSSAKNVPEDELLLRCWTLWEALLDFGITLENVKKTIAFVIDRPPGDDGGAYVWGFRKAIDFLALDLEEADLPAYDARKSRAAMRVAMSTDDASTQSTPFDSAFTSPDPSPGPRESKQNGNITQKEQLDDGEDVQASDFDSDTEPDDLVTAYLTMKERLYRHKPELVESPPAKGKKAKPSKATPVSSGALKPNERRLQTKMRTMESDMLFDKHEADQRWDLRRIQIMQELAAARDSSKDEAVPARQNGVHDARQEVTSHDARQEVTSHDARQEVTSHVQSADDGSKEPPNTDDDVDVLGDMFADPEENQVAANPIEQAIDNSITIRDMGKFAGLSPRRILEDTCRGRDGKARVTFRPISASSFASRHSVTVSWSVDQPRVTAMLPPYLRLEQQSSQRGADLVARMALTMIEVACPDAKQSEAFAATVALFYIASTSQKDEKAYMKLPPSFRDLYLELVNLEREEVDATDRETIRTIRNMLAAHSQRQEDDGIVLSAAFRNRGVNSPRPVSSRGVSPSREVQRSPKPEFVQLWNDVQSSPRFQQMLPIRMGLPMYGFKEAALGAIEQSQVIILCGETGCGKSTQLPSYVLEHELSQGRNCKIYCTQPRRISAISLAQRVSEELGEQAGDVGTSRSLVGYAIRLESKISARTRLVYATVGVVLRMLESSKSLDDVTHLIIDEVHERSIDTDFLLIVLRALMERRPELKVVLMSATVDATRFSNYLGGAPIINVPGRTFPVQTKFLEDAIELTGFTNADAKDHPQDEDDADIALEGKSSGIPKQLEGYSASTRNTLSQYDEYRIDFDLIVRLMEQIAIDPMYAEYSKATLVFLPGIAEIRQLNDLLTGSAIFQQRCWVIPLHSTIASEDQQLAFRIPPPGVRKVVLATNIAETGITIPDVTCVIDTGKHKEMRYDERRQLSRLIQSFISRANAKQRRGRAGRVQEGLCFHLFTKHRHDELMAEQQTPEMLRLSLQDLVMRVKICGLGKIEETLAQALDPPLAKNVRRSIETLIEVGALTTSENLTTLGAQLAKLPLDANLGKLCLLSAVFGCLDVGLTISAILSSKSPFVTPFGDRQRADNARLIFTKGDSDLLTAYNAYTTWRRINQTPNQSVHSFCRKNFLSHQNLCNIEDLKSQLLSSVADTGLVRISRNQLARSSRGRQQSFVQMPDDVNESNEIEATVASVIAWSFYPKLLVRDGKGWRNVANSQQVSLHPTSVNKGNRDLKFLSYYSIMASTAGAKFYNALSTTGVADLPLLLLAGDGESRLHAGLIVIDGNRLRFRVSSWKDALVLKAMRQKLRDVVDIRMKDPQRATLEKSRIWMRIWKLMCESYAEKAKP